MEISMDWTPYWQSLDPSQGAPIAVFPSPKLHESAPEAFARGTTELRGGFRTKGKQRENFPSFQQNWLKNDTHTHTLNYFITWIFPEIGKFIHVWGKSAGFSSKTETMLNWKTQFWHYFTSLPPPQTWRIASLIKSSVGESSNQICTLFKQKRDDIVCIYTMGTHNLHFSGL